MPEIDSSLPLTFFEIRVPKSSETSPEAMAACFQALPQIHNSLFDWFFGREQALAFEIVAWNQRIYFLAGIPTPTASYFTSQLTAQYPQALISQVSDFLPYFFPKESTAEEKMQACAVGNICMAKPFYLPLKTYKDFTDIDPLSTVLGALAKADPHDKIIIQFLVTAPPKNWQNHGDRVANSTIPTSDPLKVIPHPQKALIEQKIAQVGFKVAIRILVTNPDRLHTEMMLTHLSGSFASVTHGEGNSLKLGQPHFWQKKGFFESILKRHPTYTSKTNIFTAAELATLYHLPNQNLTNIRNIAWGGTLKGEPPENLPIAMGLTDEQKKDINFFARTEYKNRLNVFGIKRYDRRKHMYIIGKTGTGKSTLIANMAINDMRNGEGLAIVDPHGDLCNIVLDYIPKYRLNDVVYLDPNNIDQPFRMNPLEIEIPEQSELVASGIVAIFHKLFAYSWGPRLEYILRNTIMTLTQVPNTTLLDVVRILTNTHYRKQIVEKLQDQTLKNFWTNEFDRLDDRSRTDAVSPILNKVGQFITSPKLRAILERPKSSINLEDIMNNGKILLLNLSQGRIGEDNAALLGAMFITKMQLAAMNRVNLREEDRRDFYLYVDEFQNFATSSFVKILSEARKYRLDLTVANQYTAQVDEDVQKAIFGNVGTIVSFLVGSADAKLLNQEFGSIYEEADLVGLDNFEIITKLSIDNRTSNPFPAKTLPLPKSINQNREKAIRLSLERYGKPDKKQLTEEKSDFQSLTTETPETESSQPVVVPSQPQPTHELLVTAQPQGHQELLVTNKPQPHEVLPINTPQSNTQPAQSQRRQQAEAAIQHLTNKGVFNQPIYVKQQDNQNRNDFHNKKKWHNRKNNINHHSQQSNTRIKSKTSSGNQRPIFVTEVEK